MIESDLCKCRELHTALYCITSKTSAFVTDQIKKNFRDGGVFSKTKMHKSSLFLWIVFSMRVKKPEVLIALQI